MKHFDVEYFAFYDRTSYIFQHFIRFLWFSQCHIFEINGMVKSTYNLNIAGINFKLKKRRD